MRSQFRRVRWLRRRSARYQCLAGWVRNALTASLLPGTAVAALAAAAPLADRLADTGPPGDRPNRAAPGAGGGELPAAALRAGPALPGPG